ncbi:hypothetical protein K2173_011478 [Erythroxylum novogranatense]|uniref:CRIB domain-containing protein n=1 Tax=Erythroxylum novogranatense TaxID=1862640 RepID=A0AAV8TG26_9ROSI|nr:hypothetical protein K2173_011478 [Erythroxylum novogranatense]
MSTKVKGLFKGLRYFSQIFDEKEPELQIGLPTDVKHVAHIGMDGPDASKPSWMNEFQSEMSSAPLNSLEEANRSANPHPEDASQPDTGKKKHRSRRPASTGDAPSDSPTKRSSDAPRQSRRHRSSNNSMDSKNGDSDSVRSRDGGSNRSRDGGSTKSRDGGSTRSRDGSRTSRRHQSSTADTESSARDQPSIPKYSRVRKSKGSSSSRQQRSKEQNHCADAEPSMDNGSEKSRTGYGTKSTAGHLSSVLEAYKEEDE